MEALKIAVYRDPKGDGGVGFGSSGFVRGENGSTQPAGQAECRPVSGGFCLHADGGGEAGGCCKMQQPRKGALFQGFADGLYRAWSPDGGHGAKQSNRRKNGNFHGEGFRADEEGVSGRRPDFKKVGGDRQDAVDP